jgi:polysaccharide deacetylase family protein (PEP-CTERM system associated)
MRNALTIDLEDWFCSHNLSKVAPLRLWPTYESRIRASTQRLLSLLRTHRIEATFFVLGWVAEQHPDLITTIAAEGHEIASHGYSHIQLHHLTPDAFRRDLDHSLTTTFSLVGTPIAGFRAPAFSLTTRTLWATDILREYGFHYDSSIFPLRFHPDYGVPTAPLTIYRHPNTLIEVPLTCTTLGNIRLPCSGGAYFRLLPYALFKQLMKRCHQQKRPVIFYIHPWEVDPDQPYLPLPMHARFRHYTNLSYTFEKLQQLLTDFQFTSIRQLLKEHLVDESNYCI